MRRPFLVFSLIALGSVVLDQVSKYAFRAALPVGESITLIPGVFYLTHVRNEGAAFGMLQGRQPLFMLVTTVVLVSVALWWWRTRHKPRPWPVVVSLGLIAGGALGNLIDRMTVGYVTDMFDAAVINFPVFNIADICIFFGTVILVVWLLFSDPDAESTQAGDEGDVAAAGVGGADVPATDAIQPADAVVTDASSQAAAPEAPRTDAGADAS